MASDGDVLDVIKALSDVLVMVWDAKKGWNIVNEGNFLPLGQKPVTNALENMVLYVQEEEKETYKVFLRKITAGMKGAENFTPIKEGRLSVSVHMRDHNNIYIYYKTECYLMKDEEEAVIRMSVIVRPLDAEEIYRLHLAQNITNDRTPAMFLDVAKEIVQKNPQAKYALIQFDVVKFKAINEVYGEEFGDEMLNHFIESLKVICNKD